MKIFCMTCREWVFNTTDDFKCGGPYHGGMFQERDDGATMPDQLYLHESVKGGDLHCPRCRGLFITNREIYTEHGIIRDGQTVFSESFYAIHTEGPYIGKLKGSAVYSEEPVKRKPKVQDNSALAEYEQPKADAETVKKLKKVSVKKVKKTKKAKKASVKKTTGRKPGMTKGK